MIRPNQSKGFAVIPRKFEPPWVLVWAKKKDQTMKGKRPTTEQKIRILRAADYGKRIRSTQAKD